MTVACLLALLAMQGAPPTVTATVDRSHLSVGDELTLIITATSRSSDPMRIMLPSLDGFEILARSERTSVALTDSTARTTTLELELSAIRAGTFRLGPFQAEQAGVRARTGFVSVLVDASAAAGAPTISSRLNALLSRAPPPSRPGEPALTLVVSSNRVYVGEQVDVVTAAWFPRDLRARLRRPPTLTPPSLSGVWSYPQPAPPGIAASRKVGDTWYDLFVSHQIVFPLVAGKVDIAKASLQYSVPVAMQFFSQEERFTLESNGETLDVRALPEAGRPASFSGAVGRGLSLRRHVDASGRAGEAVPVEMELSGRGNVALWPAPAVAWPDGLRRYQDRTDDRITNENGYLGGTKTFRFLALPDSAGPLRIPATAYSYFDLDAQQYRTLSVAAATVMVAPAPESASSRPAPPPLLTATGAPLARRVWRALPATLWIVIALLPVALWAGLAGRDSYRRRFKRRASDIRPDLPRSDRRLLAALRALVPDAEVRTGPALVSALRAAGVEQGLARRIAGVRDAFLAVRYGQRGAGRSERELAAEMDQLTRALGGESRHRERRGRRLVIVLLPLLALPPSALRSQAPSAESLYEAGTYRASVEQFRLRTEASPSVVANWYGLGAAWYRLGSDAHARAAWLEAARLAPRSAAVRRALVLTPGPNSWSRRLSWVAPVTPEELAVLALGLWLVGWSMVLVRRRRFGTVASICLALAVLAAAAATIVAMHYHRPMAIVLDEGPMRVSPHERAPQVARLTPGSSVIPRRSQQGWWLVDAGGRSGWLPGDALARVDE